MYVSMSVRSHRSQKRHVHASRNFLYILSVAMTRPSFDDNAIYYVLPVLWTTSCFHNRRSKGDSN